MRMCATRCMSALSGCSSPSHSHWGRGGGSCSPFHVLPSSSCACSTRKRFCAEIFGGTRNIRKGSVIVSFRIFGKSRREFVLDRRRYRGRRRHEGLGHAEREPGVYPNSFKML